MVDDRDPFSPEVWAEERESAWRDMRKATAQLVRDVACLQFALSQGDTEHAKRFVADCRNRLCTVALNLDYLEQLPECE